MTGVLFSFGHGYSAAALARRLLPQGWRVIGTTRAADKAAVIAVTGVEPLVLGSGDVSGALAAASHVLISAGPGERGDPFLATYRSELAEAAPGIRWVGYLSTTGVYGDHGGGWVDEDTPLTPSTVRGRRRVEAESAWNRVASELDLPLHIFRLAGIYGPGRGPFAKLRSGSARRIIKPGQVFSRIHVEDIAQVLAASMAVPSPGAVYNLCDDAPAPPQDVIAHAARLIGCPVPPDVPFEEADLSPMGRSFYAESKRVRNDRIRNDLGVKLLYPDYQTGLAAILAEETGASGQLPR